MCRSRNCARQFVDDRKKQEERPQRKRELAPAFRIELKRRIEDITEQRLAEGEPAEQHTPNSVLTIVGFILMKTSSCS